MEQQQGIRRRFSNILAYSIGMCRSKAVAECPVSLEPATTLPSRVRKPRLADLFSADSDEALVDTRLAEDVDSKTTSFQPDYYRKSCSSIGQKPHQEGKCSKPRRRGRRRERNDVVVKGGGSVAVSKRSVDPYEDFKRSMVEMIVEKEIFGREELEELLLSFLGLNSPDHHKIIVLVFVDILHLLFSNSS